MDWIDVGHDSSTISRLAHDGEDLFIEFKPNAVYQYSNVPRSVFERILSKECISKSEGRPSYGATVDQLVKKAGYPYRRIN